jgi:hypothetical protein
VDEFAKHVNEKDTAHIKQLVFESQKKCVFFHNT